MTTKTMHMFDQAVSGATAWIDELAAELEADDPRAARRVLRAVMHAIRDRMQIGEAAQLAAQMPELVRGMFYDDWVPGRHSPRRAAAFLDEIAGHGGLHGETEASFAVAATMRVLRRHISEGELADVIAGMPDEIKELLT